MRASKWQQGLVLIVMMNMAWTTGCTSLQAVPVGDDPPQTLPVAVGQSVRITTKDGRKEDFKVTAIEPDAPGRQGGSRSLPGYRRPGSQTERPGQEHRPDRGVSDRRGGGHSGIARSIF